jgi:2-polyprenyl-6-methoxyphenol hydroxylase-like FAD-dependent oxidoreductase
MTELLKTNVLIVGAGPSGMTMALALARFGISCVMIDRRESNYEQPRAHALNSRTLEMFSALGMDIEAFKAVATPVDESCWVRFTDTLDGGEYGKLPYERMHADENLPTPWPLFNIAQPAAEAVMQRYVEQEELIQVLRPCEWKSCEHVPDGVDSIVLDEQGREQRILSRYLIAADGAGSPVRESQGIAMKGMGIVHDFVMIHFKADLSEVVKEKPAILYWVMKQDCSGTFIAFDQKDNWVFMYPYDEADTDLASFTENRCRELVHRAIGRSDIDVEILGNGSWGLGSQVAESYRCQNVFLVGDSAHRYPPTGGLGLNTGVGDAHNLAWKIAGVLKDWAWPGLLDGYHSEREHVAQINADFSTENAGKLFSIMLASGSILPAGMQPTFEQLKADSSRWAEIQEGIEGQRDHFDGLALHIGQHYGRRNAPDLRAEDFQFSDVGARFPHTWLSVSGERASSLELLSATRFTFVVRDGVALPEIESDVPWQVAKENEDFSASSDNLATMGMDEAAVVLVRPDGHIAERFLNGSVTALEMENALSKAVAKFVAFDLASGE